MRVDAPLRVCHSSTIWKQTARDRIDRTKENLLREKSAPEPAALPAQQKRKDRRIAVNSVACIRYAGREEVAVAKTCRVALSFKSRKNTRKGLGSRRPSRTPQGTWNIFFPHNCLSQEYVRHVRTDGGARTGRPPRSESLPGIFSGS